MRKFLCAVASIAVIALVSCNYHTTKSGLKYRILGKAAGAAHVGTPIKVGDIVKCSLKVTIPENKDTVLRNGYGQMPSYAKVDTGAMIAMSPVEILPMLHCGDSVELMISIDSILNKMPQGQAPPFFKKGQHIKYTISILDVFATDSLAKADFMKEQEKEIAREKVKLDSAGAALDKYIATNNIKAVKTPNGAYVVITNAGDQKMKADSGMQVTANYTGTVLGGKVFDSNTDSAFHHMQPYVMIVKNSQTMQRPIQGWDEAMPYFAKGATGQIYIPAGLGYGARQMGPNMPPYSNLVFDVQILDVKKAEIPKQPPFNPAAMHGMHGMHMPPPVIHGKGAAPAAKK